jgi:hypothetical protein
MANARYWREQVARLHRATWESRHRYRRRLPDERLQRLRLRNDPTSAYRHYPAFDSVGSANATVATPQAHASS